MPRARSVCSVPGCSNLAALHGRCAEHARQQRAQYEAGRPTAREQGYDAKWAAESKRFLAAFPNCMKCGQPATEAHHIVALADGGSSTWGNLMSLCKSCHSKITAKSAGWGKRKRAA